MEVISKTEVKKLILGLPKERFKRIEFELLTLRRTIRKLEEELFVLRDFKYREGKNE